MKKVTEESFLNDVKDHKLTIISDNGNTRHIRMKDPKDSYYYYDITTWGDHLCISGDMGTYVFKRCEDMFRFFRMDKSDFNYNKEKTLQINSSYWHEKLVADSTFEPAMEFSTKIFEEEIREYLESYCEGNEVTQEWKDDFLKEMEDNLFYQESEHDARQAVTNQCWWIDSDDADQVDFAEQLDSNFCEVNLKDYTNHFIWCLYAIVWGIKKYDEQESILFQKVALPTTQYVKETFIYESEFSVRVGNVLYDEFKKGEFEFVGDLIQKTPGYFLKCHAFGRKSLNELQEKLDSYNLKLGTKLDQRIVDKLNSLRK